MVTCSYTTNAKVYPLIGVTSDAISTTIIDQFIIEAQSEVDQYLKSTCCPKTIIKKFSGNFLTAYVIKNIPLLNVKALQITDTTIDVDNIDFDITGRITLDTDADERYFVGSTSINNCKVKYEYGFLEEDVSVDADDLAAATTAGSNEITVTDASSWAIGSYVKIEGFDSHQEVVKITARNETTETITVTTYQSHEISSTIQLMRVPLIVQDLCAVLAAIKGSNYMIGSTYTFATSYSLPDYSVTKGVPYPHFRDNIANNVKRRQDIYKILAPFPVFA